VQGQLTAPHTAQHTATHTATQCNTVQHTAPHCNTLQHAATHCVGQTRQGAQGHQCWSAAVCECLYSFVCVCDTTHYLVQMLKPAVCVQVRMCVCVCVLMCVSVCDTTSYPVRILKPAGTGTVIVPGTGSAGTPELVSFCVVATAETCFAARLAVLRYKSLKSHLAAEFCISHDYRADFQKFHLCVCGRQCSDMHPCALCSATIRISQKSAI